MVELSKDLLYRVKKLLSSDFISDEEVIYLGFLANEYIDSRSSVVESYLMQVCKYTESSKKKDKVTDFSESKDMKYVLEKAKVLLTSNGPLDEEILYLGFLTNQYIDSQDLFTGVYLSQVCKFTENNNKGKSLTYR